MIGCDENFLRTLLAFDLQFLQQKKLINYNLSAGWRSPAQWLWIMGGIWRVLWANNDWYRGLVIFTLRTVILGCRNARGSFDETSADRPTKNIHDLLRSWLLRHPPLPEAGPALGSINLLDRPAEIDCPKATIWNFWEGGHPCVQRLHCLEHIALELTESYVLHTKFHFLHVFRNEIINHCYEFLWVDVSYFCQILFKTVQEFSNLVDYIRVVRTCWEVVLPKIS